MVVFGEKRLYSGKLVVYGKGGCIRANVAVFVKTSCFLVKDVVFGPGGSIRAKWLNSGKVVVI